MSGTQTLAVLVNNNTNAPLSPLGCALYYILRGKVLGTGYLTVECARVCFLTYPTGTNRYFTVKLYSSNSSFMRVSAELGFTIESR